MDQATMDRLIDDIIEKDIRGTIARFGVLPSQKLQGLQGEIPYFDPSLDKSYGEGDDIVIGKDIYCSDVFLFVERVKDLVTFKGPALVNTNLNTVFRGSAQTWYMVELTDRQRRELRGDTDSVDAWCFALIDRFKELTYGMALSKLIDEKYTVLDARNRREPAEYVQAIARYAKRVDMETVYDQLKFAYKGITTDLLVCVEAPENDTTIAKFIEALDLKKKAWFDLHSSGSSSSASQPITQSNQHQPAAFPTQQMQPFTNPRPASKPVKVPY